MHRVIGVTAIFVLVLGALVGVTTVAFRPNRAIPFKYMWVEVEDEDDVASVKTSHFTLLFEGYSFGWHMRGGSYPTDGRYDTLFTPDPEAPLQGTNESEVEFGYSSRLRCFLLGYRGHRVSYSSVSEVLEVDGQTFSTAEGPVTILIHKDGAISQK